jgi:hypothetical protein
MANNSLDFMKDVLATPLGELISSIGEGVADAQAALDAGSLAQTLAIYSEGGDELLTQLRDIGYQPTFYALPETEVEATISLALSGTAPTTSGPLQSLTKKVIGATKVYVSPLNASNTNKFNMNVNAATKLKFKIVPVPPAAAVADIRVAPTLDALSLEDATELLLQFGLEIEVLTDSGDGLGVKNQIPDAGTIMKLGDTVQVEL